MITKAKAVEIIQQQLLDAFVESTELYASELLQVEDLIETPELIANLNECRAEILPAVSKHMINHFNN